MNPQYSLFLEGSASPQSEGRHSRTPSLCSTISTASSTSVSSTTSDNEDAASVDIEFAPRTARPSHVDSEMETMPTTPLTARPTLTRTISLPPTSAVVPPAVPFAKSDKLFTSNTNTHSHSNSASNSTLLTADPARAGIRPGPLHRRTVSSISVGETRRTYKFGGKVFVPLRMDGWRAQKDESIQVVGRDVVIKEEDEETSAILATSPEAEITNRIKSFKFPAHSDRSGSTSPDRKPLSVNKRIDRAKASSPYPARPSVNDNNSPAIMYKRSRPCSIANQSDFETKMVQPRSLPTSLQCHLSAPERKIILVGPAICQHLQNGGSVRVKDFTGAVVGWMH